MTIFWSYVNREFIRVLTEKDDNVIHALCSINGGVLYKYNCRYESECRDHNNPNIKELKRYRGLLDKFDSSGGYHTCPNEVNGFITLSLYGSIKYKYQECHIHQ